MDRPGADFFRVVRMMQERRRPTRADCDSLKGRAGHWLVISSRCAHFVGRCHTRAWCLPCTRAGDDLVSTAQEWREKMVSAAAEASDELMDKYLETGDLTEADMIKGLRIRTISGEIQPMLCGSAFKNKGVQRMLMR
jgi:elongation factor G